MYRITIFIIFALLNLIYCSPLIKPRIIGGANANLNELSHQASIFVNSTIYLKYVCTGTILSNEFVITAAHCLALYEEKPNHCWFSVGSNIRGGGTLYNVKDLYIHSEFNRITKQNDIALMRSNEIILFSDRITPIALDYEFIDGDLPAIVMGWGISDQNNSQVRKYL